MQIYVIYIFRIMNCKLWTKFIALNINGVIVSGPKINLYLSIQLVYICVFR